MDGNNAQGNGTEEQGQRRGKYLITLVTLSDCLKVTIIEDEGS